MVFYTKDQIESASNSPIYKPDYDETDIALYNLMANDSQDVIDQYTRTFMALPTTNPYSGVLENPNFCTINDLNNTKNDVKNTLSDLYNNQYSDDPTWQYNMNPNNKDGWYNQLFGDPFNGSGSPDPADTSYTGDDIITGGSDATVTSSINLISDQSNRLIANIASILGMVQAALGIASILGNLLNPCSGLSDFFKSISDEGAKIISDIKTAFGTLLSYIASGIGLVAGTITTIVGTIVSYAEAGVAFILKEIKKLVSALIGTIKSGISGFLKSLNSDPCASFLMKNITTDAAAIALGSVI